MLSLGAPIDRSTDPAVALLVDEGPIALARLALVVALVAGLALAAVLHLPRFRGAARTLPGRLWPLALAIPAALNALMALAWLLTPTVPALVPTVRGAALVSCLGSVLTGAAASLAAAVPRRSLQAFAVVLAAGAALSLPLHAYVRAMRDVTLYDLALPDGPERVHVGSTVVVVPVLQRSHPAVWLFPASVERLDGDAGGWHPEPRTLAIDRAGPLEVSLEATRPWVRQVAKVTIEAGEDRGNPALPLAVGNRWRYKLVSRAVRGNILGDTQTTSDRGALTVTVIGDESREGIHVWKLSFTEQDGPDAPPRTTEPVRAYAFGGALYQWNGQRASKKDPLFVEAAPITTEGPCTVAFMPGYACTCAPPRGAFTLAGPVRCHRDEEGSAVQSAFEGLAFLLSMGLAAVTGKETSDTELVEAAPSPGARPR